MHFCPTCSKWFHESCLTRGGHTECHLNNPRVEPREVRFERSLREEVAGYEDQELLKELYSGVPQELVDLARSPIVRGGKAHGIVGNARLIFDARSLLCRSVMCDEPVTEDWMEELSIDETRLGSFIAEDENGFICPSCKGVI